MSSLSLWRSRWSQRLPILSILLLAAALRWADLGLVEYKYDEAHITGMALGIAQGGGFPLLSGGTSLGIPRAALDAYLLATPFVFVRRPEAAVWLVGALGVIAVALTYALASQIGGRRLAWLAALYMAANPWLVLYDRKLWAHIQVVFSVALLWVAWQVVVRGRTRSAFWFPVLAALQLLAHVLALVQALSWVGALLVSPRRWWQRWTAWGAVAAMLLLAPYGWGLLNWARSGLAERGLSWTEALAALAAGPTDVAPPDRWHSAWQVLGGAGIAGVAGLEARTGLWWRSGDWLAWIVLGLLLVGLGRILTWLRQPARRQGASLLLMWLVGPALALALGPLRLYPQYWTAILPLPALFFGLGVDALVGTVPRRGRWVFALTGAALVVMIWTGGFVDVQQAIQRGAGGSTFGIPLARWQQTLAVTRSWAERLNTDRVQVAVRGLDPGQQSDPAAVATLIGNPPFARFVAPTSPPALLLASDQPSLYLWAIEDAETEARLDALGDQVWEGRLADGLPLARLFELPPADLQNLQATSLNPPAEFDVGLSLVGYNLPEDARAGEPFELGLIWQVTNASEAAQSGDFTAFNHVLDEASGERAGQVDGLALLSRDWWPGDVLIQPYRLQLAAGTYVWRLGLYSRVDGRRSQLVTGGDFIDLGPFRVQEGE